MLCPGVELLGLGLRGERGITAHPIYFLFTASSLCLHSLSLLPSCASHNCTQGPWHPKIISLFTSLPPFSHITFDLMLVSEHPPTTNQGKRGEHCTPQLRGIPACSFHLTGSKTSQEKSC